MQKVTNADRAEMVNMVKHVQECDHAQFRCMETGEPTPFVEFIFYDEWRIEVDHDNEHIAYAYRRDPGTGEIKHNSFIKLDLLKNYLPNKPRAMCEDAPCCGCCT